MENPRKIGVLFLFHQHKTCSDYFRTHNTYAFSRKHKLQRVFRIIMMLYVYLILSIFCKVFDVSDDELENVIGSMTSRKQVEELTSRLGIKLDKEQSPLLKLKEWRNKCNGDERLAKR